MKNTSWFAAAFAAGAIGSFAPTAATAHAAAERVTPALQQAIPNIPGKSLVAVVVDYPPGGASPAHEHAKSAFIYGYVVSGAIESQVNDGPRQSFAQEKASTSRPARNIPSAATRARPGPRSCSPCSWWTPTTPRSRPPRSDPSRSSGTRP